MQFVIRIDVDESVPSLSEILDAARKSGWSDDTLRFPEAGNEGEIASSKVTGTWEIEDGSSSDYSMHPLTPAYRKAAIARYAKTGEVEVSRFAPVSIAPGGALVQGWLFVPEAELKSDREPGFAPAKPPQSVGLDSVRNAKSA